MKLYQFVPYWPFTGGENAFIAPSFWYRCVGKNDRYNGLDYYLFPLNSLVLIIRLFRRLYARRSS